MRKSFTLIETIVVIAVIGVTLPVIFAIILTLIRQQVKISRLSQVKREGDYVISLMENTIRNRAVTIHSDVPSDANIVCKDDGSSYSSTSSLYFLDEDKQWFGYLVGINPVASNSAYLSAHSLPTIKLTSSKTVVSFISIGCSKSSVYSPASISLKFDICYDTGLPNCATARPEEKTLIHYQAGIKLRSH